ncbi:MAG: LamB/YcsF family protein [Bacteroidales bacterium]|nr:LamB/YcsF family protein [Bacteroidales bacterium]
MSIDINCDLGESFGSYKMGNDAAMMEWITSANIACGFHAGDHTVMRRTVRLCIDSGVAIGAHPGYPDIQGFGRRSISFTPEELYSMVLYQVGALKAITESEGGALRHVKPHGAMYNDAAGNIEKAMAIAEAVRKSGDNLIFLCLHGSAMEEAARKTGILSASEAFADRQYDSAGNLVPRTVKDSVINLPAVCAARTLTMVTEKRIISIDGKFVAINPDSICVHGDTPGAEGIARTIRKTLEEHSVPVKPLSGRRMS